MRKKSEGYEREEKKGEGRGEEGRRGREGRGEDYVIALEIWAKHGPFSLALNPYLYIKWQGGNKEKKRKKISQGSMVPQ